MKTYIFGNQKFRDKGDYSIIGHTTSLFENLHKSPSPFLSFCISSTKRNCQQRYSNLDFNL